MSVLSNLTVTRAAAHRQPAWMGLGNVFQETVTDYAEMMRLSTLDQIEITEETLSPSNGDARFIVPVKAFVATDITTGDRKVIGIVGEDRTLIKPDEAFSFLQTLSDGAAWEIAGTLRDDRTVFGALKWDRESNLPNGETVNHFLVIATAFDGTMPLTGFVTPVRPECSNTLTAGMREASQSFKIRQTKNARDRMAVQADMFRNANGYVDSWEKVMRDLFAKEFSDKQFENIITHFFPKPDAENVKGALTKWEDKRDAHFAMWNADHNSEVRNTAYGAFNVLTEVQQWGRQERDSAKGTEAFYLAGAGFDSATEKFRTDALSRVRHLVNV